MKAIQLQNDGSWQEVNIPVDGLSASMVLVTDASGNIIASNIPANKLVYLTNVTSDIQTQINNINSASGITVAKAAALSIALG